MREADIGAADAATDDAKALENADPHLPPPATGGTGWLPPYRLTAFRHSVQVVVEI